MSQYISHARMQRVDRHWQATNASICGEVAIGEDVSVWFGATIRGDIAPITIGRRTNIQEGACVHVDTGKPLVIGEEVTIGHGAVVHCKSIGDGTLIGMNAVVLGEAVVGKGCIVAAGCVVSPGTVVPDGMVIMGVPGKVVRPVREAEAAHARENMEEYVELAGKHVAEPERYYR